MIYGALPPTHHPSPPRKNPPLFPTVPRSSFFIADFNFYLIDNLGWINFDEFITNFGVESFEISKFLPRKFPFLA